MIHIVIPCYNMEVFVDDAIRSVKSQTSDNWDCIVVDDGSTDSSGRIIDRLTEGDPRFRVIHTRNKGVAHARNLAIREAGDGYILPLDADDVLAPRAVEVFSLFWRAYPDASLLVPRIERFGDGRLERQERLWTGYEELKRRCTPTNSSCFRYDDWKRVGGYRSWSMYEDWEFWLRLLYKNDNVVNIPEVLVGYRVRPNSRVRKANARHAWEVSLIRRFNPEIFNP